MNATAVLWLGLLLPLLSPVSAALAGGTTWVLLRKRDPNDGELIGHFIVLLVFFLALSFAAVRSDSLRHLLDPRAKVAAQIGNEPVNAALKKHFPTLWWGLEEQIESEVRAGGADKAHAALGIAYSNFVTEQMPLIPAAAAGDYAGALLPALRELRDGRPRECVQLVWRRGQEASLSLADKVSPAAAASYEAGLVRFIAAARRARDKEAERVRRALDAESAQAYAALRATLPPAQAEALERLGNDSAPRDMQAACDASIEVLTRARDLPETNSRAILIHVLRGR